MIQSEKINKKKMGLVELYGHNEVLYNFYKLLRNDFDLVIFTTHSIFVDAQDYFGEDLKNWKIKPDSMAIESFVKDQLPELNTHDIIIFTTLTSSFKCFAAINFRPLTILAIHNVNAYLNFKKSIWLDQSSVQNFIYDLLRLLRTSLRRDLFFKGKILEKFDYLFFSSGNLNAYAREFTPTFSAKILPPIPFSFYEKNQKTISQNQIIISIPGSVSQQLKDYEMLYQALKKLLPKVRRSIRLQLLGISKYGAERQIRQLENDTFEVISFDQYLSQKKFDQMLKQSDFVILPIKKYKKFGITRERYGTSSISGGVNDIIRFGLPTLLIDSYEIDTLFAPLISTFSDAEELSEKMIIWINQAKYIEIKNAALPKLAVINEENARTQLVKQFTRLLNQ